MILGNRKKNSSQNKKKIVIKEGSEEDVRLSAVLDIVLEADLKRLQMLTRKYKSHERDEGKR